MRRLTEKQRRVLNVITAFWECQERPPTTPAIRLRQLM